MMFQNAKSIIQQRIEEFEKAHGGPKAAVRSGNYWLYPDGARRDVDPNGVFQEPPVYNSRRSPPHINEEDVTWENLQRRIEYHEAKVAECQRAFEARKAEMWDTDYSNEEMNELDRLARRHAKAQKELNRLKAEQEEHPKYKRRQGTAEVQAKIAERMQEKRNKLKKVRI